MIKSAHSFWYFFVLYGTAFKTKLGSPVRASSDILLLEILSTNLDFDTADTAQNYKAGWTKIGEGRSWDKKAARKNNLYVGKRKLGLLESTKKWAGRVCAAAWVITC